MNALPTRIALTVLLGGAVLLLGAVDASARAKIKKSDKPTFEGVAEVVEVQVPVNVVGRDGKPVTGLTADSFLILDDGEEQEVSRFEVVDFSLESTETDTIELIQPTSSSSRRHFLLLFDLTFSTPASIIEARLAARKFVLNSLHPNDLVAVATFSMDTGPRLIVTFTPDRSQVARAIDTLGAPRLLLNPHVRTDPLRFIIEDPAFATTDSSSLNSDQQADNQRLLGQMNALEAHLAVIGVQMQRMEKSFSRGLVGSWAGAMRDTASFLNSVSGRKHVIYFSEGFDGRLMLGRGSNPANQNDVNEQFYLNYGQYWMVDTDDIYGNTGLQADIDRMLEEFRRADCVIQAVDISGLKNAGQDSHRVGQEALFYMANETGGALFEDANDLDLQLRRVLKRTSVTYLLTFQPKGLLADGSYHRLKIRGVDLPKGAKLAHRSGYYAPRPYDELHPLEKSLLASDAIASAAPKNDIKLNVLAAPFRANESRAYVPIIIEADGESILSGDDDDQLTAEFYTYVSNKKGEMKDFFTQMVSFNVSKGREQLEKTGIKYYGHLDVGPGEYLVRVLVRNATTGRTGVQSLEVSVPSYEQQEAVLLPPFMHEPQNHGWLMVREQRDSNYQRSVVYPFTVNGEPFVPAARRAIASGDEVEVCLVAYNMDSGELVLEGSVMGTDGIELQAGRLNLLERTITGIRGLDKLRATFSPSGLDAGDYSLRVAVTHPATGETRVNSIPFSVR